MNHPIVQFLLLLLAVWMLMSLSARFLGQWAVVFLTIFAVIVVANLYMLRHHRGLLGWIYQKPVLGAIVHGVCRMTANQPPVEPHEHSELSAEITLRESDDFAWATGKLRNRIFAHDYAIEEFLECLRGRVLLRSDSAIGASTPLATLMMIAPNGTGKRYLAHSLAGLLYRGRKFTEFDLSAESLKSSGHSVLFGDATREGSLTRSVRRDPFQVIVLENIQHASSAIVESLLTILRTGRWIEASNRSVVRFEHVVFFLSVSDEIRGLNLDSRRERESATWTQQLNEILVSEYGLDPALISLVSRVSASAAPGRLDCARVIASLMRAHCQRYELELEFVAAEIIADEVASLKPSHFFELVQSRLESRMERAILGARENASTRLRISPDLWPHLSQLELANRCLTRST